MISVSPKRDERVNLAELLDQLGDLGVRSVMVEGGAQILTSFLTERLIDYAAITVAPLFVGGISAMQKGNNCQAATPLPRLTRVAYTPVGPDLILWGEPVWENQTNG